MLSCIRYRNRAGRESGAGQLQLVSFAASRPQMELPFTRTF
jgi:hypothetical protein